MATLADLKLAVLELIGDVVAEGSNPIAGSSHSASLLLASVSAAIDAILPWMPKASVATLTGDSATTVFDLPTDLYRLEAVWYSNDYFFKSATQFVPRYQFANPDGQIDYIEYPEGKITFSIPPAGDIKIYYSAVWAKPAADDDDLETPAIAYTGISLYAASHCLLPDAVAAANVRQYGTKIDAGTPIHNPVADMSKSLLARFEEEMRKLPERPKGIKWA